MSEQANNSLGAVNNLEKTPPDVANESTTERQLSEVSRKQDNDSPIEHSSEVISNSVDNANMDPSGDCNKNKIDQSQSTDPNNKSRSNSESHDNSFQSRIRKSGSFLSKLNPSNDNHESSNLPSSIASAFSSFSSFTSNFTLNSSSANHNGNDSASGLTIETASTSTKLSQITESREEIFLRKATIERKNLINLTKLIVRDLISSSLTAVRTIEEGCQNEIHLNNYFTLIDRVLKHGLKQNLLSNRSASLWNALDSLPKYLKESTLMSESIRSLANTKSSDGKIKAWMRLAMMQKKLPEYFGELLNNKDVLLKDIYHDYAFMLNEEAHVFAGLIIGINVIDCNFFVKDANFDMMDDIIDLSPYLRAANSYDEDTDSNEPKNGEASEDQESIRMKNMKMVLDQKSYLEERNKRLESTISNLQAKIKTLDEHTSKLEMEAKVSEVRIQKLQSKQKLPATTAPTEAISSSGSKVVDITTTSKTEESSVIHKDSSAKNEVETSDANEVTGGKIEGESQSSRQEKESEVTDSTSSVDCQSTTSKIHSQQLTIDELEMKNEALEQKYSSLAERAGILETSYRSSLEKIKVLERDLDAQTSMNADKETTIKIYEKDIRDKQAQVESLRASLNDAKKLNSDLNERLNDTTTKLKERLKSVSNLQASLDKWKLENKTLATKLQDKLTALKAMKGDLDKALKQVDELKKYNEKINDELKRERESGQFSSVTVETQNTQISELTARLKEYENELKDVKPYKDRSEELAQRCKDYEQSLEEIGAQLRESRLELDNLKENSAVFLDSQWMDSKQVKSCALCELNFSVTRRKHHCRLCGNVFCQTCSDNKMELASSAKPVRVCDTCHSFLLAKFVKQSSASSS